MIDLKRYAPPLFVTLTHHQQRDTTASTMCFRAWLQRIRREFPNAQYLWRKEPQKRGTQHFHVILFFPAWDLEKSLSPKTAAKIQDEWHEVSDPHSSAHKIWGCNVQQLTKLKALRGYVSKYLAKVDAETGFVEGRQWGNSRGLEIGPLLSICADRIDVARVIRYARKILTSREDNSRWVKGYCKSASCVIVYTEALNSLRIILDLIGVDLAVQTLPDDAFPW